MKDISKQNGPKLANRLDQVSTYYFAKKLKQIEQMDTDSEIKVINLGIGSPDLPPHPKVIHSLQTYIREERAHEYQSYKGHPSLRNGLSAWYKRYFNVEIDANNNVLPLMGSKEGILHISMTFINPGDEVLIPNPGYPSYRTNTLLAGGVCREMRLSQASGWMPDLELLECSNLSKVKLLWINYPNMPTGAQANDKFFQKIMEFGIKHKILICHDNPYALITTQSPHSLLSQSTQWNYALELTSMSKNYNMAGWRVGAVVSSKENIDNILKFKSNMDSGMFRPLQQAAAIALQLEDEWIDALNAEYKKRKILAQKIFDQLGITYQSDGAGLFLWGKINQYKSTSVSFSEYLLQNARVFITPGIVFGDQGEQYLRISLCSPLSAFEEALDRVMSMSFKHMAI